MFLSVACNDDQLKEVFGVSRCNGIVAELLKSLTIEVEVVAEWCGVALCCQVRDYGRGGCKVERAATIKLCANQAGGDVRELRFGMGPTNAKPLYTCPHLHLQFEIAAGSAKKWSQSIAIKGT